MYISTGLLDYMPLAQMPFNKVNKTKPTTKKEIVENSKVAIEQKANKYRYEDVYAYYPHNANKLYPKQGRNVDFVVA